MEGHTIEEFEPFKQQRQSILALASRCRKLTRALGDETRQGIMAALLSADEVGLRVGQITASTNLSRPAVSHHLKVMKDAGIVTLIKRGTKNYYFIDASSPEWEALWAFSDATRSLAYQAHKKGYPAAYEKEEI